MRILIATGGAEHSNTVLNFAAHLVELGSGPKTATLLTVIRREVDRAVAETTLSRAMAVLQPVQPGVQAKIRLGHPAEEIIREAQEGAYRLVIVGQRQRHQRMPRFLLGATTERVVAYAPCPVLIARGQAGPFRRILLCDSGVDDPPLLSRFTTQLAQLADPGEQVTVLHVMSQIGAGPGVEDQDLRAEAEKLMARQTPEGKLLQRDLQVLGSLAVHPRPKVRHGLVVDEIAAEAQAGGYDLVVIGAHRGTGWQRILLDDLAHRIIAHLPGPVLVVR